MSTHKDQPQKLHDWMELRNYPETTVSPYQAEQAGFVQEKWFED